MKPQLETYQPRSIRFVELVNVNNWDVKIYTISNRQSFDSHLVLENVIKYLPKWIDNAKASEIVTYQKAFLIVHEAREGVLILLNWWTGGEMVETEIAFVDYSKPYSIVASPYGTKSLVCIWELEIFAHERKAWIDLVLLKANQPDFNGYLKSVYNN